MKPETLGQTCWRANKFITSVLVAVLIMADRSVGLTQSHGHQSRTRTGGGEFYSPQLLLTNEPRLTNVTTQIGTNAFLPCKVNTSWQQLNARTALFTASYVPSSLAGQARQLANKSVSWIRVRDNHILTVDRLTFIADDRYQAFYVDSTGLWTLQIKYVQARDAGLYECQVGTEPKVSARAHLHVVGGLDKRDGSLISYTRGEWRRILIVPQYYSTSTPQYPGQNWLGSLYAS